MVDCIYIRTHIHSVYTYIVIKMTIVIKTLQICTVVSLSCISLVIWMMPFIHSHVQPKLIYTVPIKCITKSVGQV